MKKLIPPALTGVLFIVALPSIAPAIDFSAFFPHLSGIYTAIENLAKSIIPDEIEQFVSALNDKLL